MHVRRKFLNVKQIGTITAIIVLVTVIFQLILVLVGAGSQGSKSINLEASNHNNISLSDKTIVNHNQIYMEDSPNNWKVYKNNRFGFSIAYPNDFYHTVEADNRDGVYIKTPRDSIKITISAGFDVLEEHSTKASRELAGIEDTFVTDSGLTLIKSSLSKRNSKNISFRIFSDGILYSIEAEGDSSDLSSTQSDLYKMLRSFRLIDGEEVSGRR